jgi:hypothetical protein
MLCVVNPTPPLSGGGVERNGELACRKVVTMVITPTLSRFVAGRARTVSLRNSTTVSQRDLLFSRRNARRWVSYQSLGIETILRRPC